MRCVSTIPPSPKIAFVGDFSGKDEALLGRPFVGQGGQELGRILSDVGLTLADHMLTNVFLDRPPEGKIEAWCDKKKEVSTAYKLYRPTLVECGPEICWPFVYTFDKIKQRKYIHPKFILDLARLKGELEAAQPNLIVALGGIACWALIGTSSVERNRGACTESSLAFHPDGTGMKVLPTYHPNYILRAWSDRVISLSDMEKARREMEYPSIRRKPRFIYIPETIQDLWEFFAKHLNAVSDLSVDIEAHVGREITCIGFAPDDTTALVIPFTIGTSYQSYWSEADEILAVMFIKYVLENPKFRKTFQNGLFDIQYIYRFLGIKPRNCTSDTMLIHHALQPELPKGLGFLGSIYTDEAAWKLMRKRAKDEMEKKDE